MISSIPSDPNPDTPDSDQPSSFDKIISKKPQVLEDAASKKGVQILGIHFFTGSVDESVESVLKGGLLMLPSGPGLACDLTNSAEYRESLAAADFILADSGAMVLAWNFLHFNSPEKRVPRISGLRFLRALLEREELRAPGFSFWVMPSIEEQKTNLTWLKANGFAALSEADCYVAPHYRKQAEKYGEVIQDPELVRILEERRPAMIFLNVGSGVQEPLGAALKNALSYQPAIICSGAAIAFLTGEQASISPWADRLCLGWLLRILQNPSKFGSRYLRALPLFSLLIRYRSKSPIPR